MYVDTKQKLNKYSVNGSIVEDLWPKHVLRFIYHSFTIYNFSSCFVLPLKKLIKCQPTHWSSCTYIIFSEKTTALQRKVIIIFFKWQVETKNTLLLFLLYSWKNRRYWLVCAAAPQHEPLETWCVLSLINKEVQIQSHSVVSPDLLPCKVWSVLVVGHNIGVLSLAHRIWMRFSLTK